MLLRALASFALLFSTVVLAESTVMTVRDGWVRPAPPVAQVRAGYLVLVNPGEKELVIDRVDSKDFGAVEIHEAVERRADEHAQLVAVGPQLVHQHGRAGVGREGVEVGRRDAVEDDDVKTRSTVVGEYLDRHHLADPIQLFDFRFVILRQMAGRWACWRANAGGSPPART